MTKRSAFSNYYNGPAGNSQAVMLAAIKARLTATMQTRSFAARYPGIRVPRNARQPQAEGVTLAAAERRPHRVTPRMSTERRVASYQHGGRKRMTSAQQRRIRHKAQIASPGSF